MGSVHLTALLDAKKGAVLYVLGQLILPNRTADTFCSGQLGWSTTQRGVTLPPPASNTACSSLSGRHRTEDSLAALGSGKKQMLPTILLTSRCLQSTRPPFVRQHIGTQICHCQGMIRCASESRRNSAQLRLVKVLDQSCLQKGLLHHQHGLDRSCKGGDGTCAQLSNPLLQLRVFNFDFWTSVLASFRA